MAFANLFLNKNVIIFITGLTIIKPLISLAENTKTS